MSRSKSGQLSTITIDPSNSTNPASPNPATPKGPHGELKFILAKGYIWVSPYITVNNGGTTFGTATLGPNGNVTVTDVNEDGGKYSYMVYYANAATGARERLTIDPEIQNSADN